MIHSDIINNLDELERGMLYSMGEHVFGHMGLSGGSRWVNMFRVDTLKHLLSNINNLTEEGVEVRNRLLIKLGDGGF